MSYILDALNKSEQERRARSAPDLNTHHAPAAHENPPARWAWLIGSVLVSINLIALAIWFFPVSKDAPEPQAPMANNLAQDIPALSANTANTPPAVQSIPQPSAAISTDRNLNAAQASANPIDPPLALNPPDLQPEEDIITPTDLGRQATNRLRSTISIAELPQDLQRQLPDMQFSSHLYSDDFKLVNINGQMMKEGETIAPGVELIEITEDGVVIQFRDRSIEMSVLRNWSFD